MFCSVSRERLIALLKLCCLLATLVWVTSRPAWGQTDTPNSTGGEFRFSVGCELANYGLYPYVPEKWGELVLKPDERARRIPRFAVRDLL